MGVFSSASACAVDVNKEKKDAIFELIFLVGTSSIQREIACRHVQP